MRAHGIYAQQWRALAAHLLRLELATSRLMASIFTGFLATLRLAAISCCRICAPGHSSASSQNTITPAFAQGITWASTHRCSKWQSQEITQAGLRRACHYI